MDLDFVYSCVIDSTWFFLTTWLMVLLGACIIAFRGDSSGVVGAGVLHPVASVAQSNPKMRAGLSR
jgi:hypothetical protein